MYTCIVCKIDCDWGGRERKRPYLYRNAGSSRPCYAARSLSAFATGRASMGPRSVDRGNGRQPMVSDPDGHASMGPRSVDRGNATLPNSNSRSTLLLQWGRDQLTAEIRITPWLAKIVGTLQWGRDQLTAEMRAPGARFRAGTSSFNGAAIS
jgi:hypothetical protein